MILKQVSLLITMLYSNTSVELCREKSLRKISSSPDSSRKDDKDYGVAPLKEETLT